MVDGVVRLWYGFVGVVFVGVGPWADGVIGGLTGSVRSRLFIFWSVGISSWVWVRGREFVGGWRSRWVNRRVKALIF